MNPSAYAMVALFLGAILSAPSAYALREKEGQVILDELKDYELCQKHDYSGDWCHDAMKRWVKAHPDDAFQAGKMTRRTMNHWVALPFFNQAFGAKKGNCKDEDVKLALISALDLPSDSNGEIVKQAKALGLGQCFNEIKDDLVSKAAADSYLFKNVCHELIGKGLLAGLKKKKCEAMK